MRQDHRQQLTFMVRFLAILALLCVGTLATLTGQASVDSMTQLDGANPAVVGDPCTVNGYFAAGDGGGGTFYFSAGSTATTNYGTVLAAPGGRWLRDYTGAVDVRWFGCIPTETPTDMRVRIQNAFDNFTNILFPNGTYWASVDVTTAGQWTTKDLSLRTGSLLTLASGATLRTTIPADQTRPYVLLSTFHGGTWSSNVFITGGKFEGYHTTSGTDQMGHLMLLYGNNCTVSNVVLTIASTCVTLRGTNILVDHMTAAAGQNNTAAITHGNGITVQNSSFSGTRQIDGNSPASGIDVEQNSGDQVSNLLIANCTFEDNDGQGLYIQKGGSSLFPTGITISNCTATLNKKRGFIILDAITVNVMNCLARTNTIDGLYLRTRNTRISECTNVWNQRYGSVIIWNTNTTVWNSTFSSNTSSGLVILSNDVVRLLNLTTNGNVLTNLHLGDKNGVITDPAGYYIDYVYGSDSNNGTSVVTPWKLAPGMIGFAGAYTHAAGDKFYFKGGVTWPRSCFQWKISKGGSSDSVRDWYKGIPTWFSGEFFSRPCFDFEDNLIGSGTAGAGVLVDYPAVGYVTFDNLDFMRHRAPLNSQGAWGAMTMCLNAVDYVTMTNCMVRDWSQASIAAGEGAGGGIVKVNASGGHNRVTHCEFHQLNAATQNGASIQSIPYVDHNEIHHTPSALIWSGGADASYNHIHDLTTPGDPNAHSDAIMVSGSANIHHNVIHDCSGRAQVIMAVPAFGNITSPQTVSIYDNVIYNVAQPCVVVDRRYYNNPDTVWHIYNNTLEAPSGTGWCVRVGVTADGLPGQILNLKNNHYITSGTAVQFDKPASVVTEATCLTNSMAAANAAGYSDANEYAPSSAGSPTVNTGTALAAYLSDDVNGTPRPQGASWDIGAYELGASANPGALSFATDSYSTAEDTTLTLTVNRTGGSTGAVGASYATANGTGLAGTDYTAASGTVSVGDGVTSATFSVTISRNATYTGNRHFTVALSNPTGGATLASPTNATVTITDSDPAPDVIPTLGTSFNVAEMLVKAPFVVSAGVASQSIQTLTTNSAGVLLANCNLPVTGKYRIRLEGVKAETTGSDSVFVRVDDATDICDVIPVTSGNETRWVNGRGAGTPDKPENQPLELELEAGAHLLAIYGREAHCGISNVVWVLQSDPPPATPQQLAFEGSSASAYDGAGSILITVLRVGTAGTVSVNYATVNGTALAGIDYTAVSGTLTFGENVASQTISIPLLAHPTYQGNKVFEVQLSSPVTAELSNPSACSIAILDDASMPGSTVLNAGSISVNVIIPKP